MLMTILGFITGLAGPIRDIAGKIADLKIEQTKAETDQNKVKVQAEISELQARQAVLVAEAGSRLAAGINAFTRLFITIGPAAFIAKIFLWDKVIGAFVGCSGPGQKTGCGTFVTDPLDTNLWGVVTAIIAFYFVYDLAARFRR